MQDFFFVALIAIAFCAAFGLLWTGIVYLASRVSGWSELSNEYPAIGRIEGITHHFSSARVRWIASYRNCLTIIVSPAGIFLEPFVFFKMGHKPILIPWSAVLSHQKGLLPFYQSTTLEIERKNGDRPTTLTLYGKGLTDSLDQWLEDEKA